MTDSSSGGHRVPSNGTTPPPVTTPVPESVLPGTEVTTSPGLFPEPDTFTVDTSDLNLDINIDPSFINDPLAYVPPVDTHEEKLNEIHAHLHELSKKLDHLLEHHHKAGLPTYEGTVSVKLYPQDTHVPNDTSSTEETTV